MAIDRVILLDENTANRIAAGEVVERPASAVKELVENAIDSGATQISIMLEEGGKQRIVVSDNGCGMTRSDAILALQRHATSKIRSADDLFAIRTLGFRGEALPSIASVSHLAMTTKPGDEESGTRLLVNGGDVEEIAEVATNDGTTIDISSLFFNTPARLKFLKSTPTELARTVEVVGHLAVAYPGIAFRVQHGTQALFSTPGTGDMLAALASVWGRDIARTLIPVQQNATGLEVTGFIATPDVSRPGRSHESFFVNKRPIKSRLLNHALEDAFRALTPDSRYPIAAIFVDITPDMVDVNVHPTKTEVKFTRDGEVHHAVSQAIKTALLAYGIVPTLRAETPIAPAEPEQPRLDLRTERRNAALFLPASEPSPVTAVPMAFVPEPNGELSSAPDWLEQRFGAPSSTHSDSEIPSPSDTGAPDARNTPEDLHEIAGSSEPDALQVRPRPRPFAEQLRDFRVLGQVRNTYIVAATPDGIAVVDQHVAHERVLYERLTVKRFSDGIPVQRLVVPLTLNLSRREAMLMTEHYRTFAASGWDITPFGGESFIVRSIPAVLCAKPYEQILRDMVDELVNDSVSRRLLVQKDHVTITNACKMAVKAGDPLNIEEMQGLLEQLAETENPYLCPHGRPIVVTLSFRDLDKLFKRT